MSRMVRGFYTLGSSMMTNTQTLSTISNNIANAETIGFKKDITHTAAFGDMLVSRLDSEINPLGNMSLVRIAQENDTIHSQGTIKETGRNLDFAITGSGFFGINTGNGIAYTRNGSFSIDNEGYLVLKDVGRVIGQDGEIYIGTDEFTADSYGNLSINGALIDKIQVYDFEDYNNLEKAGEGLYTGQGFVNPTPNLIWKALEGSNVDMVEELTNAISATRNLQSCSQVLQMYDVVLSKAVEIGKL